MCNLRNVTEKRRVELMYVHDVRRDETGNGYCGRRDEFSVFWVFPDEVYDQHAESKQMQVARQIPRLYHALIVIIIKVWVIIAHYKFGATWCDSKSLNFKAFEALRFGFEIVFQL